MGLQTEDGHYRRILETMSEGFAYGRIAHDSNGSPVDFEYLDSNEAFSRLLGQHDVKGRKASDVTPALLDAGLGLLAVVDRVVLTGDSAEIEGDVASLGLTLHISVFRPEAGCFAAIVSDITERMLAEQSMREDGARFENLFQQAPLGYQSLDEEGRFLEVNERWLETLGYSRGEVIGRWFGDFLAPEFADAFRERFPLFKARGAIHSEFEMMHKDGERRVIAFEGRIGHNPDGTFKQTHCILADITERNAAEKALRASEEKFKYLFERSVVPKSLIRSDGEADMNDAFCEMLGYTREEIGDRATWQQLTHPDDVADTEKLLASLIAGEMTSARFEKRYIRKDGGVVWADVNTSLRRDADGIPEFFMTTIIDITDRKRVEEDLRRTSATLQAAMDQSPAGIAIADAPDGALRYVNDAGLLIRGSDRASIVDGIGIAEYVASWQMLDLDGRPLEPEEVPLARAVMFGETNSREFIVRRIEGDDRIVLGNAAPIRDDDGEVVSAIVVFTDITDQKKAEEELRKSRLLLVSSVEAQKDTILFSIDRQYRYLFYNQAQIDAMKSAYGVDIELGACVLDYITSDDDRVAAKANYDRALAGESHSNVRIYGDVQRAYYESFFNPILDEDGQVVGATGLARDITDRKAAEEALVQSEARLGRAVQDAPVPIMIHAEDGEVLQISREWERITGYSLADIPTTSDWTERAYGFRAEAVRDDIEALYGLDGPHDEGEYTVRTKDGNERVWYFRSSPLGAGADGRRTVVSTALDVTERRHAEDEVLRLNAVLEQRVQERTEELEATNEELHSANDELAEANLKLEEATRAKNDFLASMSHELRTPLNSIIGFSGILSQELAGPLNAEQTKQIGMINNSGRHLLELVNEVLDLAKVESGQSTPVFSKIDVCPIVREMFDTVRPMAEEKGLEMRMLCPDGSGRVRTDGLRAGQIVLNLAGNAVKFTKDGYVAVSVSQDASGVTVTVEDSGCGIAAEDLDRIFDDFFQVEPHSSARSEGTGLGLAVCKRLADSIGASIEVSSELGRGSAFSLHLPYATA